MNSEIIHLYISRDAASNLNRRKEERLFEEGVTKILSEWAVAAKLYISGRKGYLAFAEASLKSRDQLWVLNQSIQLQIKFKATVASYLENQEGWAYVFASKVAIEVAKFAELQRLGCTEGADTFDGKGRRNGFDHASILAIENSLMGGPSEREARYAFTVVHENLFDLCGEILPDKMKVSIAQYEKRTKELRRQRGLTQRQSRAAAATLA